MSLKPSGHLKLGPAKIKELVHYFRAMSQQHMNHPILSGAVPLVIDGRMESIWITYCKRCVKLIGMSLVGDNLSSEVAESELNKTS